VELPRFRTPISTADGARHLVAALSAHGVPHNRNGAALILAQVWLETARGKACDNNNPGNITGEAATGYFRPIWFEPSPDASPHILHLHDLMLQNQAPSKFRAYPTLAEGFSDYASHLSRRYQSIVDAANANDADAMARAIKTSGYTPDLPDGVGPHLRSIQNEFLDGGLFGDVLKVGPASPIAFAGLGPLLLLFLFLKGRKHA
jgi:hypothetical protein